MRVLEVASVFPPHVGGLEVCVYEISKRLVPMGHQVIVYSTNLPRSKTREYKDGMSIRRIPVLFTVFGAPVAIFLRYIIKEEADLIHVHIPPIFGALSSLLAGRIKKVPVVLTYHSDTRGDSPFEHFIATIYNVVLDRLVLSNVRAIVVPSQSQKLELCRRGISQNRIRVISNGFDFQEEYTGANVKVIKQRLGLQNEKIVLFVGALEKRKGVEYLLRATSKVLVAIENVKVMVVGDGNEKGSLQDLARSLKIDHMVRFMGYVTERARDDLYEISDVFVLPSLHETFGLVLLEAMSHKKPIVATKTFGAIELVKTGFNGLLVEQRNPEQLAAAIVKILSRKDYGQQLGENGRRFSRKFGWEKTLQKYAELYDQVNRNVLGEKTLWES